MYSEEGRENKPITWRELLRETAKRFEGAQVPESELDAWYLMEACFSIDRSWFFLHGAETVKKDEAYERFLALAKRREKREPLQYLLGEQMFMGLPFSVNESVLIPRQDTECLVELVLKDCGKKSLRLLDMCTGSGCILLSLLHYGDFSYGLGVDLMEDALAVARENACRLALPAEFIQSDLFENLPPVTFDVIVSNPPYVTGEEMKTLEPEVLEHEPHTALYAPENGLVFYKRLAAKSGDWLKGGGRIYLEIGYRQGPEVKALLEQAGFAQVQVHKDLAGLDRVVSAIKPMDE